MTINDNVKFVLTLKSIIPLDSSSGMQVFIAAKNYLVLIFCNSDYMEPKKVDSAFLISRQGHTLGNSVSTFFFGFL